jgi:hypothetical protein
MMEVTQLHFAFLLKTYAPHLNYAKKLLDSIVRYNLDSIHTFIVAPSTDVQIFESLNYPNTTVLCEDNIPTILTSEDVSGIRPGYINQEIIKLAFHRMNLVHHYLCLDSDGEFLRDFKLSDFVTSSGQPYTILIEDNEIQIDSNYFERYWKDRKKSQDQILRFLGMDTNEVWLNCHGFQILSADKLSLFDMNILKPHNFDYIDLMKISPYEFSWYNYYLQTLKIPLRIREPLFKVFHTENQLAMARFSQLNYEDLSRGYLGVCINSNFLGNNGAISLEESIFVTQSRFLKYNELFKVILCKLVIDFSKPKILMYRVLSALGMGALLRLFSSIKRGFR